MPLFLYRCPTTGHRVQGFSADAVSKDAHIYDPVVCTVCKQIHHVNPATGTVLAVSDGSKPNPGDIADLRAAGGVAGSGRT
jgi:hypothetical protein